MKKIIFFLVINLLFTVQLRAQAIYSYGFESSAGTYEEITGGTVVYSQTEEIAVNLSNRAFIGSTTSVTEKTTSTGFLIGFDFLYGGSAKNQFAVSPQGLVFLGNGQVTVDPENITGSIFMNNNYSEGKTDVIGTTQQGTGVDVSADNTTEIRYELTGAAPNRVLVVQFKKLKFGSSWSAGTEVSITHQIRLYEGTNNIQFVYNEFDEVSNGRYIRAGLKGSIPGDIHLRSGSWANSIRSTDGNFTWNKSAPDDGLAFTFTPPPACVTPASQPTDLVLTPTSNSISGSFTATAADKYLVLMGKDISMVTGSDRPTDGVTYNVGDVINNKMTVVAYSSDLAFSVSNLESSSTYSFYVYAVNAECLYGPKYNTVSALSGTVMTLPPAPQSLTLSETGFTNVKLAVEANANNHPVIIAQNIGQWATDNVGNPLNDGVFGTPTSDVNVGDQIPGGGKVIYIGAASNAINVTGLKSGKLVNFAAWSYDGTQVSSAVTKLNVTTWATTPYFLDVSQYAPYNVPVDWEREGTNFQLTQNTTTRRGNLLEGRVSTANPENPVYASFTTQYLQLTQGSSRLVLSGVFSVTTASRPYVTTAYSDGMDTNDSIVFSVQKLGETDYVPFYTINSTNAEDFFKKDASPTGAYTDIAIPIEGFGNETVKVKVAWTTHKPGTVLWTITKFLVEEKPDHEAPVNLTVAPASIIGSQAEISWDKHPIGTESAWEVRYRPLDAETWSTPVQTSEPNYAFTNLPTDITVEVAVRAVVGLTTFSPWSFPFLSFKTGYGLPYSENFNNYTNLNAFTAGSGWTLTPSSAFLLTNPALWLRVSQVAPQTATALLPKLDFEDGSVNYQLAFDLSVMGTMPDDNSVQVIVDGEEGFLKEYPYTVEGRDTISLTGFSGIKRIGFKVIENTRVNALSEAFVLDNVAIFPTCPVAVSNAQAEVASRRARVSWEGEADEWLVFIRQAGETTKVYEKITEKSIEFTDLEETTDYEIGVTTSCAEGDTAKITFVRFTTLSTKPCDPVSDIVAIPTTGSVTISWESESETAKFNIRFHKAGDENWTERTGIAEHTYTFTGLTHNTEYECSIQTVCSNAYGDYSDYTETATVKTVEITCFEPNSIVADPLTYRSATLSWEGDADKYELSWAKTGDDWTDVIVEAKTYALPVALTPVTGYQARIRSICAVGDTSVYSPLYSFTTLPIPACPVPTALSVTSITDHSAVLSWTANEANTSWALHHRSGTVFEWTDVPDLTEKTYMLTGLTEDTHYLWSVKASCEETANESGYASANEFDTTETGIASVNGELRVEVSNQLISVLNPEGAYIDYIRLYATDGSLLQDFSVRSTDNVLIPTSIIQKTAIVKVVGNNSQATFKVLVK
jgi:hypothetical protein